MVVQYVFLENPNLLFHFCEACIFPGHVLIHTTDVSGDDVSDPFLRVSLEEAEKACADAGPAVRSTRSL